MIGFFIAWLFILPVHDIHVSVTEIDINPSHELNVSVKLFYDDLLNAVGLVAGEALPDNYISADDLIYKYLSQHFEIRINDQKTTLELVESNAFGDAVWVDLKANTPADDISKIEIFNDIFISLFDDQSNLIKIAFQKEMYSTLLNDKQISFVIEI